MAAQRIEKSVFISYRRRGIPTKTGRFLRTCKPTRPCRPGRERQPATIHTTRGQTDEQSATHAVHRNPHHLILAGIFFNWSAANSIRTEVKDVRTDLRAEIKDLRMDLRGEIKDLRSEMYSRFADQDKKLEGLKRDIVDIKDSNHKDALEIMRQMTELHERVALVESRQK